MKKWLALVLLALTTSGCAVRTSSGTIFFLQRGVILQLSHSCTNKARVYQAGPGLVGEVIGATPIDIGLHPAVPGDREITVMVQSLVGEKVMATYTQSFQIDSQSTQAQSWVIGNSGHGGYARYSRCE